MAEAELPANLRHLLSPSHPGRRKTMKTEIVSTMYRQYTVSRSYFLVTPAPSLLKVTAVLARFGVTRK